MRLFLVRHAQAGDRMVGARDLYRPLSPKGRQRAEEIGLLLAPSKPDRILSSPATRCVQTVEPLAARTGLDVEEHPDLWEGSTISHVLSLLGNADAAEVIVACSHGDVIPEAIEAIAAEGAQINGRGCEKGSIWVVERDGRRWAHAYYLDRSAVDVPAPQL